MGAICPACDGDMTVVFSCRVELREGVTLYGADVPGEQWYLDLVDDLPFRCRDCGVVKGGVHHPGCCVAQCTTCEGQRFGCPCDVDLEAPC